MRALFYKEIRSFLSSVIGYTFILIFLITSGLFHWVISDTTNLLEGSEADMIPFFNLSPYIFLILIPAITMRSIAEERRSGTIELLFTRPISDLSILLAKYLAGVCLVAIALLPTLIFYYSIYSLSLDPAKFDHGATITSYLGLLLLGAVFVAIGLFASSITSSQIVAFILAMFLCWIFYQGLDLLGSFNLMGGFDFILQYIGIIYHYDSIKRGVIDSSDIVYFLTVIITFIFASLTVIKSIKN
ncbi:MAG: gliding motility-associated ABC transporter permease subunit GldF [Bacteroidetes bacterium]|nr:MAG: gliding motility-associated ABC transporter permease subunit GldF [Bacteroidota bacterium]